MGLRKVLVVFQFVITIVLIISTIVIGLQLNFIQTKDIGLDKEKLVVIDKAGGCCVPDCYASGVVCDEGVVESFRVSYFPRRRDLFSCGRYCITDRAAYDQLPDDEGGKC